MPVSHSSTTCGIALLEDLGVVGVVVVVLGGRRYCSVAFMGCRCLFSIYIWSIFSLWALEERLGSVKRRGERRHVETFLARHTALLIPCGYMVSLHTVCEMGFLCIDGFGLCHFKICMTISCLYDYKLFLDRHKV